MSDPVQVSLIRQDESDCQNSTVPDDPDRTVGTIACQRQDDGTTVVLVDCSLQADKSYVFNLKCVRMLGTFQTGDEGTAQAKFLFNTGEAGDVYAFDCYQDPPISGDKYQSVTVKFS